MKKYSIFIIAAIMLCTACQKVVDADNLLNTEEKVFITSYISPQDTVLRVNVSRALPAIGTPLSVQDEEANRAKFLIKDAIVRISDEEGNETNLTYLDALDAYVANATTLAIEENKRYFLEVRVADKTYSASCQIPKKVGEIEGQIRLKENESGFIETEVSLRFDDFMGERNFYMLGGSYTITIRDQDQEPLTVDGQLLFGSDQFATDAVGDGEPIAGTGIGDISFSAETEVTNRSVTLQVAHMEEIIFQNFRTASANANSEGSLFVEYAIAPNNILDEGAVGVFAGYQLTEKVIEVESSTAQAREAYLGKKE